MLHRLMGLQCPWLSWYPHIYNCTDCGTNKINLCHKFYFQPPPIICMYHWLRFSYVTMSLLSAYLYLLWHLNVGYHRDHMEQVCPWCNYQIHKNSGNGNDFMLASMNTNLWNHIISAQRELKQRTHVSSTLWASKPCQFYSASSETTFSSNQWAAYTVSSESMKPHQFYSMSSLHCKQWNYEITSVLLNEQLTL